MENKLLKLVTMLSLMAIVSYVVASALEKKEHKQRDKNRKLTQFPQASRVWFTSPLSAQRSEAQSVQPQSMLYR